jgi:hypothetical protein
MAGVAPPEETTGAVAVTDVTPPAIAKSPLPKTELPLIVLMFVPLTRLSCFALNVVQSEKVR